MMCMVFLLIVVPYSIYPFYYFCVTMATYKVDEAWWNSIKDHRYDVVLKFQSNGMVHLDKWGQIAMGFVTFLLFGTGTDAHNTYKKMLLFFGLGKIFPSLYIMRESGSSTRSSFIAARLWTESCVSKAKSYLSKRSSFSSFSSSLLNKSSRSDSVALENMDNIHLRSVSSTTPVLPERSSGPSTQPTLLKRIFTRGGGPGPILPLFSQRSATPAPESEKKAAKPAGEGFTARAWAAVSPSSRRNNNPAGVVVFREVHLNEEARESGEQKPADEWMVRP
jgi:pheromone a factor receptor